MFQLMPLHWGVVKGANVFVVGLGTYRGKITRSRNCVAAMEEQYFVIKMPEVAKEDSKDGREKY